MLTLLAVLAAFGLGYTLPHIPKLFEFLAPELPDTRVYPITPLGRLPQWAIAESGYYLVKRAGVTQSEYLTPHAIWCMAGTNTLWDAIPLKPATTITGYVATTPTGGKYTRRKTERVYRAYVISYWFPPSPSFETVGQGTWSCEGVYA